MTTSFPILRLPSKTIQDVIQNMPLCNLLSFSLCSRAAKSRVTQLKLNVQTIQVTVEKSLCLLIIKSPNNAKKYLTFYNTGPWNLQRCESVQTSDSEHGIKRVWLKEGFGFRDWIDHILEVFNCLGTPVFTVFRSANEGNCNNVCRALNDLKMNVELINCSENVEQKVVAMIRHKIMVIFRHADSPLMPNRKMLIQNFGLVFYVSVGSGRHFTLNDLLVMNTCHLHLTDSKLSSEDLNIFIKYMINTPDQLLEDVQFLQVSERPNWNMNVVLKGLPSTSPNDTYPVRGSFRIRQGDEWKLVMQWDLSDAKCYIGMQFV